MDKAEAKNILSSYRPEHANDPIFAEALQAVASDPELAAWFAELQRFDAIMAQKFQHMPVPADVHPYILDGYEDEEPAPANLSPFRQWYIPTSIAAVLLAGLFLWHAVVPGAQAMSPLEKQAIAYTGKMPPLQFVCFDPTEVAHWVNEQPDSRKLGIALPMPGKSMSMKMIGSSVVQWNGHPVVMICLQNGKSMAMLYIMNGSVEPGMKEGATETVAKADWVVRESKSNGQIHLLAAKGSPDDLDFPMPF